MTYPLLGYHNESYVDRLIAAATNYPIYIPKACVNAKKLQSLVARYHVKGVVGRFLFKHKGRVHPVNDAYMLTERRNDGTTERQK